MSTKTTTTVSLTAAVAEKVRVRLVEDTPDRPGTHSMGGAISWIVEQWAKLDGASPATARRSLAADARRDGSEGARLKAAREVAGLTQAKLAAAVSTDGAEVSRQQVDRAERAATLEQWPALRAWLLEQGAPTS